MPQAAIGELLLKGFWDKQPRVLRRETFPASTQLVLCGLEVLTTSEIFLHDLSKNSAWVERI